MDERMIAIAFDMDGVLIDHTATIKELAMSQGYALTDKDCVAASLRKAISSDLYEQINSMVYDGSDAAIKHSNLMPHAADLVNILSTSGFTLYILSRRRYDHGLAILRHFNLHNIFNVHNSYFVSSTIEKAVIADSLGVTHYIDDQPRHLKGDMQSIQNKFLFDQYDQFGVVEGCQRITSLMELEELIA